MSISSCGRLGAEAIQILSKQLLDCDNGIACLIVSIGVMNVNIILWVSHDVM